MRTTDRPVSAQRLPVATMLSCDRMSSAPLFRWWCGYCDQLLSILFGFCFLSYSWFAWLITRLLPDQSATAINPQPTCVLSAGSSPQGRAIPAVHCTSPSGSLDSQSAEQRFIKLMGRAFKTDPCNALFGTFPDRQEKLFEGYGQLMLGKLMGQPVLYHTDDGNGGAVVAPISHAKRVSEFELKHLPSALCMLQGMPLSSLWGAYCIGLVLTKQCNEALAKAGIMGDNCLKVMTICIDPEAQGQGLGGALLVAITAAADQAQLPLYLEASHVGLIPLYEKYGFHSMSLCDVTEGRGEKPYMVPLMVRMPQPLMKN